MAFSQASIATEKGLDVKSGTWVIVWIGF
jgi:hypothetical protein